MKAVRAKKALGQHFLRDGSVSRRIALSIEASQLPERAQCLASLPIVEVGPGMGMLTRELMATGRPLTAVELDKESVQWLAVNMPQLRVVHADFLRLPLRELYDGPIALIGNYPYNISSQIFFKVLDNKDMIPVCAGMLQREVAQRICSGPGNKDYGILSVLLQTWYDCRYLFTVNEDAFSPPPRVKSGVLQLVRNTRSGLPGSESHFKSVVKAAFGQRRKMLRSSLA